MKFNPLDDQEQSESKKELLPPGKYNFTVLEAIEAVSKSGNDMLKVKIDVRDEHIYDYLLTDGPTAWKLKSFCRSVGMLEQYNSGQLHAGDVIGRAGRCELDIEAGSGAYGPKNRVKKWLEAERQSSMDDDAANSSVNEEAAAEAVAKVAAAFGGTVEEDEKLPF